MSVTAAGGTGSITLTPGDDFTVDAGDDVSIDAAGSLFLKQDSTNILSWNDAGAVTVSAVSGQDPMRCDCERGEQSRCECDGWRYWIDDDTR